MALGKIHAKERYQKKKKERKISVYVYLMTFFVL